MEIDNLCCVTILLQPETAAINILLLPETAAIITLYVLFSAYCILFTLCDL
jgi:hypothetical protein